MRDLASAFGFFTIIPLPHRTDDMSRVAASCYLLPAVGLAIGALTGLAAWGAMELWGGAVAAAVVLSLSVILTGFHHADGLADFGDALMARGDRERRIGVLKDRTLGVGAVMALTLTCLLAWAALIELMAAVDGAAVIWYLIIVEVCARLALLATAMMSTSSHGGSGEIFIAAARGWRGIAGIGASLAVLVAAGFVTEASVAALAAASALLVAAAVAYSGKRWFGGVGGDLLGATVELARMAALLGVAAALSRWPVG